MNEKHAETTLFVVQARKKSQRVPDKMLRYFAHGKCLLEFALDKAITQRSIKKDNVLFSYRKGEFDKIAKDFDLNSWHRTKESVTEPITLQKAFDWHRAKYDEGFRHYVILNACNPLVTIETIEKFCEKFLLSDARGQFAVVKHKTFFFDSSQKMLNKFEGPREFMSTLETKFVEPVFEAAHTLYAGTIEDIRDGIYMGGFSGPNDPTFFEIPHEEFCDIDEMWQFEQAQRLFGE